MSTKVGPQLHLPLVHTEVGGVEMGVLDDGTAYLSGRGLASFCGQEPGVILTLTSNWDEQRLKPRGRWIQSQLDRLGYDGPMFLRTIVDGQTLHAHPDVVCTAVLSYYAFQADTDERRKEIAQGNALRLMGATLRQFIYQNVDYDPERPIPLEWTSYHQRLLLNECPSGYFSILLESSRLVLGAIRAGLRVDSTTIPDGSVGRIWGPRWTTLDFNEVYGERKKVLHTFPDDYPQAAGVPKEAWIYPNAALGEFRRWLDDEYLPNKYPAYLARKVKDVRQPLTAEAASHLIASVQPKRLE